MVEVISPRDEEELAAAIEQAAGENMPLEVVGGGSKREVGRPLQTAAQLCTARLSGVTLYEPNELVIAARSGTRLKTIERVLAKNGQQLAFEPIDLGPLLGGDADKGTIGAVFATNLSGSRRIQAGAARDHLLGIRAVNGRGELFSNGGRVMKNVTGYDLCRGIAGSWGTLAVLSEVTMKVLPKPEAARTLLLRGLTDEVAIDAMCAALGSPFEVSGTLHLPGSCVAPLGVEGLAKKGQNVTAIRLENFKSFLDYRAGRLGALLAAFGRIDQLETAESEAFWEAVRQVRFFESGESAVWRISVAPQDGARLVAQLARHVDCRAVYDWSGGLVWLEVAPSRDAAAMEIRRALADIRGHATLIRADHAVRASSDVFQAPDAGPAMLTARIKASFDPAGILNPGRMYAGV